MLASCRETAVVTSGSSPLHTGPNTPPGHTLTPEATYLCARDSQSHAHSHLRWSISRLSSSKARLVGKGCLEAIARPVITPPSTSNKHDLFEDSHTTYHLPLFLRSRLRILDAEVDRQAHVADNLIVSRFTCNSRDRVNWPSVLMFRHDNFASATSFCRICLQPKKKERRVLIAT